MFVCVFKINSNPFIQPGLILVVLGWTQLYLAGRFLFVFSCSLGILFFYLCRFEAMNHFVGLKLPHLSRCFTTTTTSSAPPSSKSWPKQGLLLFYLFVPCIAQSQETRLDQMALILSVMYTHSHACATRPIWITCVFNSLCASNYHLQPCGWVEIR
jgi:hypothetical protein